MPWGLLWEEAADYYGGLGTGCDWCPPRRAKLRKEEMNLLRRQLKRKVPRQRRGNHYNETRLP